MSAAIWYSSHESLVALAQHLLDAGELQTSEDMLAFFEKPWKWQAEWDSYVEDQRERRHRGQADRAAHARRTQLDEKGAPYR